MITAPVAITIEAESAKSTSVSLSDPHTIDISGIASITNNAPEIFTLGELFDCGNLDRATGIIMKIQYYNTCQYMSLIRHPPACNRYMPSTLGTIFEISGTRQYFGGTSSLRMLCGLQQI